MLKVQVQEVCSVGSGVSGACEELMADLKVLRANAGGSKHGHGYRARYQSECCNETTS